jgi:hypothetical protein
MKWTLAAVLCCFSPLALLGQSNSSVQSTSVQPNLPTKVYAPKATKKKSKNKVTYDARDDFYDRIEELNRGRRKADKKKKLPEYSNFQYFGHKKPPKKRPPEKMKYCTICGIRH